MQAICHRCGEKGCQRFATQQELGNWGIDVYKEFPHKGRYTGAIKLCKKCKEIIRKKIRSTALLAG